MEMQDNFDKDSGTERKVLLCIGFGINATRSELQQDGQIKREVRVLRKCEVTAIRASSVM